jgi:hypothetical protein
MRNFHGQECTLLLLGRVAGCWNNTMFVTSTYTEGEEIRN